LSPQKFLHFTTKGNVHSTVIEFEEPEWNSVISMAGLTATTMAFYIRVHEQVLQYYLMYTQKCFEKRVMWLTHENYFEAEKDVKFNSSRLFNELSLFFIQMSNADM